jgi:hypothetical protein
MTRGERTREGRFDFRAGENALLGGVGSWAWPYCRWVLDYGQVLFALHVVGAPKSMCYVVKTSGLMAPRGLF